MLSDSWKFDDQAYWPKIAVWAMSWCFEREFEQNLIAQIELKKNSRKAGGNCEK